MSSLSVLYCLFYMELRFTWDKSVQVHCGASCQLSNLGTKAWREVAAYYGTSVKNAGSIFRVSEIDSTLRQGSSTVGGNSEKAVLPHFRPSSRSAERVRFSRSSAVWSEGGVTFAPSLSIIRSANNMEVVDACSRQTYSLAKRLW